ncbi:MAG: ATP-binding protein [Ignavibacteriaceae bacterium]|nr:ATP-binding protein [Ignavibacteriaceae bacterium]
MKNPFIYGKIASGNSFIDREQEQQRLSANINSGINSILISPRRLGKSSLVFRVSQTLSRKQSEFRFCFIDLFNIRSEAEFYSVLAREVLRVAYPKWKERLEALGRFFRHISPRITISSAPAEEFSLSFDWNEIQRSPDEILNLPETVSKKLNVKIVVCVDEFQNIAFFDDPLAFQKKLRSNWQKHNLANYCLYGSKQHMMTELFESKSMPFYKFGDIIFLEKIPKKYWRAFIVSAFGRTGKIINHEAASNIALTVENHPYFVQQFAHTVWNLTNHKCSDELIANALEQLLLQNTILFQRETDSLTNSQVNFLRAICNNVSNLSSVETINRYKLGTSANVSRLKKSLVKKEIIEINGNKFEFTDPLFKIWFAREFLNI